MNRQGRVSKPIYSLFPTEIDGFDSMAELALDMRWSGDYGTDEIWRQLDPPSWELTHNPGLSRRRFRGTNSNACWLILISKGR